MLAPQGAVVQPRWTSASFLLYAGGIVVLVAAAQSLQQLAEDYGDAAFVGWAALDLVRLRPTPTTVAAINALPRPRRTPTTRTTGFQRHVWRVRAQIVEYKLERDAAVHLVLYDGKQSYMTAAMPSARCLPANARARRAIEGARAFLEGLCGPARPSWRPLGAVVIIDGVGFWASPHGQHGHARNYAELRPVTSVRLVAGCA